MFNLRANWPAPANINTLTTSRKHGFSLSPFDKNNFGLHVGDNAESVLKNRHQLKTLLTLPNEPVWLSQTHSTKCVIVEQDNNRTVDAAITHLTGAALVVMTADCLPITLCNQNGDEIAVIHAGWRGLVYGIIENTIQKMQSKPFELLAWIGPAICGRCFEVGDEVYTTFLHRYPYVEDAFIKQGNKWLANLSLIAELIFHQLGVTQVYQSNTCTKEEEINYYSYRRDTQTGRMATLIWMDSII